MIIARSTIF